MNDINLEQPSRPCTNPCTKQPQQNGNVISDRRESVGGLSMSVEILFSPCGMTVQQNSKNVIQINAY